MKEVENFESNTGCWEFADSSDIKKGECIIYTNISCYEIFYKGLLEEVPDDEIPK